MPPLVMSFYSCVYLKKWFMDRVCPADLISWLIPLIIATMAMVGG